MARPVKRRRVCSLPRNSSFGPLGQCSKEEDRQVILSVDEYETIRLIDLEGFTQEETSIQMNIGRTTVQGIYSDARRKIADGIVNGKIIRIDGGNYKVCDGNGPKCKMGTCRRKVRHCEREEA